MFPSGRSTLPTRILSAYSRPTIGLLSRYFFSHGFEPRLWGCERPLGPGALTLACGNCAIYDGWGCPFGPSETRINGPLPRADSALTVQTNYHFLHSLATLEIVERPGALS